MAQIFISYRRQDTAYLAATLSDKLQQHFGENSVFFDVDNIPLGVDFREYIGNAVGQCDVLLAIIGDQWMGIDSNGKRRIDDPSDYVRVEIESALKRNIPVIPVLVENALMPSPTDLPPAIESIAFRNAAQVRAGRDLRQHLQQLVEGLEMLFNAPPSKPEAAPPKATAAPDITREKTPDAPKARAKAEQKRNSQKVKARSQERPIDVVRKKGTSSHAELLEEIQIGLGKFNDSYLHIGKMIPSDKLKNALATYAPQVSDSEVLLLYDNTVFGGAKDGLILADDGVYWRNAMEGAQHCEYADIQNVVAHDAEGFFSVSKITISSRRRVANKLLDSELEINLSCGKKNEIAKVLSVVIHRIMDFIRELNGPGLPS
jgi:hypothetical protein